MTATSGASGARCRVNGATITSQVYASGSILDAPLLSTGSTVRVVTVHGSKAQCDARARSASATHWQTVPTVQRAVTLKRQVP